MAHWFKTVFAATGTKTAVPNAADPSGFISYDTGYGPDYQRVLGTDPLAKTIERDKLNQVLYDITGAVQQYQTHGFPEYIDATANGGTAYAYAIDAIVLFTDGKNYVNTVAANTNDPSVSGWIELGSVSTLTHNMTSDADYTLTATENKYLRIKVTDTSVFLTTGRNIVLDNSQRRILVVNNTLQALTFKTSAGTGITVNAATTSDLLCDGTNIILATSVQSAIKQIQHVGATVATNALTATLDPTTLDFRNTTLGSGTVTSVSNATQLSVVAPSGATLGTTNGVSARLAILAINNAGTMELAIGNIYGYTSLTEEGVISTTLIDATSDSFGVFYSTTARTNVAYRVVGFIDITEATAGAWATAPSLIQGNGGNVLAGIPTAVSGSPITASGTSVTVSNIPGNAYKLTVLYDGLSTNGNSPIIIQIGGSAVEVTTYVSYAASNATTTGQTIGFAQTISIASTTDLIYGKATVELSNPSTNSWIAMGEVIVNGVKESSVGKKALASALNTLRVTTVNGTDTFDAGTLTVSWEVA